MYIILIQNKSDRSDRYWIKCDTFEIAKNTEKSYTIDDKYSTLIIKGEIVQ